MRELERFSRERMAKMTREPEVERRLRENQANINEIRVSHFQSFNAWETDGGMGHGGNIKYLPIISVFSLPLFIFFFIIFHISLPKDSKPTSRFSLGKIFILNEKTRGIIG